jgi:uncharacterized membrane protein
MSESPAHPRLPGLDVLRGIAVLAMIIYHFAWDLRFFNLIETNVVAHPFWAGFARGIAGSFLLIAGVSLALMAATGLDRAKFVRRLGFVAGAAALVTLVTWLAFPQAYVFFGILHCIALSTILAVPFLRVPRAIVLVAAAAVFMLPFVVTHPVFDHPALLWLGLVTALPASNDYVPIFPWFSLFLIGLVIGRSIVSSPPALLQAAPQGALALLARTGRWSLPIYLVHQPILLALVGAVSLAVAPAGQDRITQEFRKACAENCQRSGSSVEMCRRYCTCSEDGIRKAELWTPLLRNALTARQQQQVETIAGTCQAQARE